jgi:ATP-dependent DNA ligase
MVAEALTALRVRSVTLDGEGVVCGPDGISDFELLRAAVGRKGTRDAFLLGMRPSRSVRVNGVNRLGP